MLRGLVLACQLAILYAADTHVETTALPNARPHGRLQPPKLPLSFKANVVKHIVEDGAKVITNFTAAYDALRKRYHIMDYSHSTYYESWGLFDKKVIYTWSPENIPNKYHCICLPASSESYLPEFYSLANATLVNSGMILHGQKVNEWKKRNVILENDTYTAFVLLNKTKGVSTPLRTIWKDPGMSVSQDTIETSDYEFYFIGDYKASDPEFIPNQSCMKVPCK